MNHPPMPLLTLLSWSICFAAAIAGERCTYLSDLQPKSQTGQAVKDRSASGGELNVGRRTFARGLGMQGNSEVAYDVAGREGRFEAWVGLNLWANQGSVVCKVLTDGEVAFDSGVLRHVEHRPNLLNPWLPIKVWVPLNGVKELRLVVESTNKTSHRDYADWGDARLLPPGSPLYAPRTPAAPNALARTPAMGWNSWNCFKGNINEKIIQEIADAMVASGMKDAGYQYISLDDGWQGKPQRDKEGNPLWNAKNFPHGMKALADYIHSKGLKFGLYSRPVWVGGFEEKTARALADWGVDYFKYDFSLPVDNRNMVDAIRKAGRPLFFKVCEWGTAEPWRWAPVIDAQSWRIAYDLADKWESDCDTCRGIGILTALDQSEAVGPFAGPGRWIDPDALVAGLRGKSPHPGGGCTDTEYRAQFSLWSLLSATLMAGNDLRKMDDTTLKILTNREVIAIDQDPLGVPGWRIRKLGDREVWCKPLANGDWAVGLFNRGAKPATIAVRGIDLGLVGRWQVRDLWAQKDLGAWDGKCEKDVASHDLVLLRLSRPR